VLFQRIVYFFVQVERISDLHNHNRDRAIPAQYENFVFGKKKAAELQKMYWAGGSPPHMVAWGPLLWWSFQWWPHGSVWDVSRRLRISLIFYVQSLNSTCFLKITILQDYFCVLDVSSEAESNQARGTHRVSFCLGNTIVLGFWNIWASGTLGHPAVSLASRAKTSIFQNKTANLKGLGPGKRKGCSRSSGSSSEGRGGSRWEQICKSPSHRWRRQ